MILLHTTGSLLPLLSTPLLVLINSGFFGIQTSLDSPSCILLYKLVSSTLLPWLCVHHQLLHDFQMVLSIECVSLKEVGHDHM